MNIKTLLFAALLTIASSAAMAAETLILNPYNTITFEELGNQPLDNIGWTGGGASTLFGTAPLYTGNPSSYVVQASGTVKLTAVSPAQTMPEEFTNAATGELLYFSAWIVKNGGGGGVVFSTNSSASLYGSVIAGFGIADGANGTFTYFNGTSMAFSSVVAGRNIWYELVYVIDFNREDPGLSLGYLYYRDLNTSTYEIVPEVNGLQLTWLANANQNLLDFAYYRIDGARNNMQLDHFSVGQVIPEPSTVAVLLTGAISLVYFRRKRFCKS